MQAEKDAKMKAKAKERKKLKKAKEKEKAKVKILPCFYLFYIILAREVDGCRVISCV
jgi:hypothetical protein